MAINIRQKGQEGEREIAKKLNAVISNVRQRQGLPPLETRDELFQRNQNQSAVGGDDLSNPLGLSIEVKRQEQLSVATWWKQCVESAARTDGIPLLIYRQNRKPWRCMAWGSLPPGILGNIEPRQHLYRVELDLDSLLHWFDGYYTRYLVLKR